MTREIAEDIDMSKGSGAKDRRTSQTPAKIRQSKQRHHLAAELLPIIVVTFVFRSLLILRTPHGPTGGSRNDVVARIGISNTLGVLVTSARGVRFEAIAC